MIRAGLRLIYTPQSKIDLTEIGLYIAKDNPRRAIGFTDDAYRAAGRVTHPGLVKDWGI